MVVQQEKHGDGSKCFEECYIRMGPSILKTKLLASCWCLSSEHQELRMLKLDELNVSMISSSYLESVVDSRGGMKGSVVDSTGDIMKGSVVNSRGHNEGVSSG